MSSSLNLSNSPLASSSRVPELAKNGLLNFGRVGDRRGGRRSLAPRNQGSFPPPALPGFLGVGSEEARP